LHMKGIALKTIFFTVTVAAAAIALFCGNPAAPPVPVGIAVLDKSNFSSLTGVAGRVSMVEFYSPESYFCREMDSAMARVSRRYKDSVLIGRVNYLTEQGLAGRYSIQVLPTFLFLKGGAEARQCIRNNMDPASAAKVEDSLVMIIDSLRAH
jgi:thiol-disulfide isomerase/thioredoxin